MNRPLRVTLTVFIILFVIIAGIATVVLFGSGFSLLDPTGWNTAIDGSVYYRDESGAKLTGWQTIDERQYYFDLNDGNLVTGWLELDGALYYLGTDGTLSSGWLDFEGQRYYLDGNGQAVIGWVDMADGRHYFGDDGVLTTGWLDQGGTRYYFDSDGVMLTGWIDTNLGSYYLNEDGTMATGWITLEDGTYYFSPDGLVHHGWLEEEGLRYFFDDAGRLYTGWITLDGTRYCFDENGQMLTGWIKDGDDRYYLGTDGAMNTGWLDYDSDRYYLHPDGTMAVGEVEIDGASHFFTSRGKYVVLVNAWNPVPEDYEADLVTYEGYEIDASCVDALDQLLTACSNAGYGYELNSIYRSVDHQQGIWDSRYSDYLDAGYGTEEAKQLVAQSVAVPGTSEHHLGLAADVGGSEDMYSWMQQHSWEYGFVVRYPEGKTNYTGIIYEPWHVRYVGLELAQELYTLNLCMEEYMEILTNE